MYQTQDKILGLLAIFVATSIIKPFIYFRLTVYESSDLVDLIFFFY